MAVHPDETAIDDVAQKHSATKHTATAKPAQTGKGLSFPPAKVNRLLYDTAFGMNRYGIFILYSFIVLLTGCTHWGWDGLQSMMYKSGAYEWLCSDVDESERSNFGETNFVDCEQRRNIINNMYTVAIASQFIFSFLFGTIMDYWGPKVCGIIGQSLLLLGWLSVGFSSRDFQLYYAGAVLIGMAGDAAYFPLLNISNLFPGKESLMLSILGSIRSASFAVPVIMNLVFSGSSFHPSDLWKVVIVYVAVGIVPSLIFCVLLVPKTAFFVKATVTEAAAAARAVLKNDDIERLTVDFEFVVGDKTEENRPSLRSSQYITSQFVDMDNLDESSLQHPGPGLTPSFCSKCDEASEKDAVTFSFKRSCFSLHFSLIVTVFFSCLFRAEFFAKSHKDQLAVGDQNVFTMFSIMNILSFLPGPLMGFICDRFGVIAALHALNISGILMYSFVMVNNIICKGIALVCMMFFISFVLSGLYCYINKNFPKSHFGKLVGCASLLGGTLTLSSIAVYNFSNAVLNSFIPVDAFLLAVGFFTIILIFFLTKQSKARKFVIKLEDVVEKP